MDSHYWLGQALRNQAKTNRRTKLRAATRVQHVMERATP